jgi:hypothetical protein
MMSENKKTSLEKALLEAKEIEQAAVKSAKKILEESVISKIEEAVKETVLDIEKKSLKESVSIEVDSDDVSLEVKDGVTTINVEDVEEEDLKITSEESEEDLENMEDSEEESEEEMEGMEDIAMADTKARLDAANRLARVYGTMADYEDKEFAINEQAPFDDTMAAASALTGAGMQNVQGALEGISRAGAAGLSSLSDEDDDDFSKSLKKKPARKGLNLPSNISLYDPKKRKTIID